MLFTSPDYPVFLIAVFFLYALSRTSGGAAMIGRIAVMLLLGDLVFVLVAKDPDMLWDPLGGLLYRLAAGESSQPAAWLETGHYALQWTVGSVLLGAALFTGYRYAAWIASERGQQLIARGIVAALVAVGATVAISSSMGELDAVTDVLVSHGHLLVLAVLGIGLGAAQNNVHRPLGRVVILFVASSLFYHAWAASMPGPYRYLLAVLLGTIVLDYYLAIWIENTESPTARKALLIVSLCSNLGILGFFKYTNFLTQDVLHLPIKPLHLILPAGISFHTFQSLSYTIDVYRRQLKATRSVVQFATFVLFFPQLVAGPIVRAQDLLPQLGQLPALETEKATNGLFRIVIGMFKKIALADTLALSIVDRVFEAPSHFSGLEVIAAVYAYALQIYLDFSAYSDIAIGSAQVLGFSLPENFRTPYRSANIQEFWRRWHISLSTWLRDYLYVTLGGNRGAPWRTYVNLILTMLLGGLWHGASWAFIVWGALHGFGLAITRFFQRYREASPTAVQSMFAWCSSVAVCGLAIVSLLPSSAGTWAQLVFVWLSVTPLWAVATAWLGEDTNVQFSAQIETPTFYAAMRREQTKIVECTRIAMCLCAVGAFASLQWGSTTLWIPLALTTWGLAIAADLVEHDRLPDLEWLGRRALGVVLTFNYVCLAWVFFRATSFDNALDVLRQIGTLELDHANLQPIVLTALAVGFAAHFFPEGSFRWLRDRFMQLTQLEQGIVLAGCALVLRELAHPKIVPFIYFQF